ncbi:MAG: PH domain-containing protein [Kiritimatiellaeota bacterium]|nr:PH domain-containing protein [Kiritimatiellota bacterium]
MFEDTEDLLLEVEPSWWHYFGYLVFGWLLIPLVIALWKQASLTLRVYPDRVVLETGLVSKRVVDLAITDINTVEISQSFFQRLCRIGDIKMATSGVEGYELVARGLPNPKRINEIVAVQRRKLMKT